MDLSRELTALSLAASLTVALYLPHLADPYVYQDEHYAHVVSPFVWHSLSLSLHLLNGLLLYAVAKARSWAWPLLLVTLFWWAPLNVEAVAYGAGQPELRITACLLTLALVWSLALPRWSQALLTLGPIGGLLLTKVGTLVRTPILFEPTLSQGVSRVQWSAWEASALVGLIGRWIVPLGLSVDHDLVHVGVCWQGLALASVLSAALCVAKRKTQLPAMVRMGALWVLVLVAPRFLLRLPLSILNEHHAYTLSPGFATLTTWVVSQWA